MTGSEVGLRLACAASEVLPHTREQHAYSEDGQELHRDAEAAAQLGDMDGLPPRVAKMIAGASGIMTEFVLAYDVAEGTARVVPGVEGRNYPAGAPFEIFMRLDLAAFFVDQRHPDDPVPNVAHPPEPRRAVVIDHKYHAEQGHPLQHGQLMTQALALARAFNLDRVDVAISYLGTGWVDGPFTAGWIELDDHADRLRQLQLDVAAARKDPAAWVRKGPHCRHCPAFWSCPAHAEALSVRPEPRLLAVPPLIDDDKARHALELLERVELLRARLKTALYARAADRPIPLGDGRMWGPQTIQGNEALDGATVYQLAAERYGREHAASFIEAKATKARLDEAIKPLVQRGGKAAAVKSFLAEVRKRGGAERGTRTEYGAYKPALQLVSAEPAADAAQEGDAP